MTPSQLGILAAAALVLLAVRSSLRARRERKQRDFTRTLETVLLPKETVKVICPQKKGRWILTNKRLLLEEMGGFHAIPLDKIKSIQNSNDQFPELAKLLQSELKKRKEKAEKKK